jgi:regulatory protein
VAQAVARLKALGYLDDAAFAQGWVHGRLSTKPRSCSLLRRELKDKGIGRQEAEEATRSMDDEAEAYRAAARVAEGLRRQGFTVFRRRLWGYLRRRGFSPSVTLRTIRRLWQEDQG